MSDVEIRDAQASDLDALIALLSDDMLIRKFEDAVDTAAYALAFEAIEQSGHSRIVVAVLDGKIVGSVLVSYLRGLSQRGAMRCNLEEIRVHSAARSHGVGSTLLRFVIDEATARGAQIVQLTSHTLRVDSHRFYERLGFEKSHIGYQMRLAAAPTP